MGLLIVCKGANFSECAVDKVEIPTDPDCKHEYDNACDTTCNLCGATRTVTHNYVDGVCTICGAPDPSDIKNYPVKDGLKGLYDLGVDANTSLVNHAPEPHVNDGTEELKEACVVEEDYVNFTGTAKESRLLTYLRLPLTNGLTYVALFSVPSGSRPIVSNRGSGAAMLEMKNDGVVIGKDAVTSEFKFDAAINSDNFVILAVRATTSGFMVDRYTNGSLARVTLVRDGNTMDAYEGVVDAWSNNAVQIGGNSTSNPSSPANISLAAIHEGVMTDTQLKNICQFVKDYGEHKFKGTGLTIE